MTILDAKLSRIYCEKNLDIINELDEEILGLCELRKFKGKSRKVVARILNAIKKIEKVMQGQTIQNTSATSVTANQQDINTSNASVVNEAGNVDIAPSTIGTIASKANLFDTRSEASSRVKGRKI